jgi:protein-disulfide isomerase
VWIYAALSKLGDPDAAVRAVRAYDVVPESMVRAIAWGLPFVELALAGLLLVGVATRAAAWASVAVLALFIMGMASAWARGLQIDCGCFGSGGPADVGSFDYVVDLARDVAFVGLALVVALGPRSSFELQSRFPTRRRRLAFQIAVVAGALVVIVFGFGIQQRRSQVEIEGVTRPPGSGNQSAPVKVVGRQAAPVLVEVFEDLRCAQCRRFHDDAEPAIQPLVESGRVRIAYHAMPLLGEDSVRAAAANVCAGDAFLAYRDHLFAAQPDHGEQPLPEETLIDAGRASGIINSEFSQCVRQATYEPWIREQLEAGSRRGVVLTPTIFVNGELLPRPITEKSLLEVVSRARRPRG